MRIIILFAYGILSGARIFAMFDICPNYYQQCYAQMVAIASSSHTQTSEHILLL